MQTTDEITWGETYDMSVSAQDTEDGEVTLDETWSAACRITKDRVGGTLVLEPTMTIANGIASAEIDTGDSPFCAGTFWYDIRLTDASGNDFWTNPVRLILKNRNALTS